MVAVTAAAVRVQATVGVLPAWAVRVAGGGSAEAVAERAVGAVGAAAVPVPVVVAAVVAVAGGGSEVIREL